MGANIQSLAYQVNMLNEEVQMLQQEVSEMMGGSQGLGGFGGGLGSFGGMGGFGGMGNIGGFGGQSSFPDMLNQGFPSLQQPSGECHHHHHHHHHDNGQSSAPSNTTTYSSGQTSLDLGDGYSLSLDKSNSQWTLTNQTTGQTTQVSGDPHVSENGNNWTFKNNTTFQLDDGTQITVKTTPAGNGATLSDELDITRGGSSIQVTGLASNDNNQLQVTQGSNGFQLAASNWGDNVVYEQGNQWVSDNFQAVNQDYANQHNL